MGGVTLQRFLVDSHERFFLEDLDEYQVSLKVTVC